MSDKEQREIKQKKRCVGRNERERKVKSNKKEGHAEKEFKIRNGTHVDSRECHLSRAECIWDSYFW